MKQFKTESKRILDLMVNSIYTNKEIFLRELISNASDAIDKLKFISLTDGSVNTDFKIKLSIDKAARTLTIEDNGIGMSEEELEKNLGTIAESGTLAFKKENDDKNGELIGQFGVGFYSAFMVADKIEVYSKKYGEDKALLKGADALYTDIWASMGEEDKIPERVKQLTPYKVTGDVMKATENSDCIFLHCLPSFHDFDTTMAASQKELGYDIREVTDEVFLSPNSKVFDEAENRMHTIKAVMVATIGNV